MLPLLLWALPQPHARCIAIQELDAGFFQGALDFCDRFGVSAGSSCLKTRDGHWRDLCHFGQLANADPQRGAGHADMVTVYHEISNLVDFVLIFCLNTRYSILLLGNNAMLRSKRAPGKHPRAKADAVLAKVVRIALDMEEPLNDADRFLRALRLIGHGMLMDDNDDGGAILAIAWAAAGRLEALRDTWDGMLEAAQRGKAHAETVRTQ